MRRAAGDPAVGTGPAVAAGPCSRHPASPSVPEGSTYRIRKLLLTAAEHTQRGRVRLWAGLAPATPSGEWPRPGRARSCSGITPPTGCRRPAPPLSASAAGQAVSTWRSCHGLPAASGLGGRDRRLPLDRGLPNGPTEAVNLPIKKVSGSGMASATSPTTGCGCCCTAASPGRLTGPQECAGAPHAWWQNTCNRICDIQGLRAAQMMPVEPRTCQGRPVLCMLGA
jgi:hypothetical protein